MPTPSSNLPKFYPPTILPPNSWLKRLNLPFHNLVQCCLIWAHSLSMPWRGSSKKRQAPIFYCWELSAPTSKKKMIKKSTKKSLKEMTSMPMMPSNFAIKLFLRHYCHQQHQCHSIKSFFYCFTFFKVICGPPSCFFTCHFVVYLD